MKRTPAPPPRAGLSVWDAGGVENCDGCGGTDSEALVEVYRVYVTKADAEGGEDRYDAVSESERWCFPCRSMYPHQELAP